MTRPGMRPRQMQKTNSKTDKGDAKSPPAEPKTADEKTANDIEKALRDGK